MGYNIREMSVALSCMWLLDNYSVKVWNCKWEYEFNYTAAQLYNLLLLHKPDTSLSVECVPIISIRHERH